MDPETLAVLAQHNPRAAFVVPRAVRELAISRGIPPERLIALNAGERTRIGVDLSILALPSAHEDLRLDDHGNHHFLGYGLELGDVLIYHSGDCVPYPGLGDELASLAIDLAILPVNGRDDFRRQNGVPGNFTFAEAKSLCVESDIPSMIACHFGMFAFNTVDETCLDEQIVALPGSLQCIRPEPGLIYELATSPNPTFEKSI
jgi:L-ascorbate metabolism protein UlaG (beta-lactamase superfamily)